MTRRPGAASLAGPAPHLDALDLFRAVAVLMVMAAHLGRALPDAIAQFWFVYGRLGVEVFFVVSGYVIPYSLARSGYRPFARGGFPVFAARRFLRIHPPYLAAVVLTFAIAWPWRHAIGLPWLETWGTAARSLVYFYFPADNPVFWSLLVEIEYYLLMGLLFPLLAHRRMEIAFGTLLALLLLARFSGEPGGAFHLPQYLPRFAAGFALFWLGEGRIGWRRFVVLVAALWLWDDGSPAAAATSITALAIMGAMRWTGSYPRFLDPLFFLGTISYSVFLIHLPVGVKITALGQAFLGDGAGWGVAIFLVAVAAALGMSTLFYHGVEVPFHRMAERAGGKGARSCR